MFESADNASWTIAEGRTNGHPFQIRFRRVAPDFPREGFPQRLNVFWAMRSANEDGLPTEDELEDLHEFENRLVPAVEKDQGVMFVAVITGAEEREFVFYVQDPDKFLKHLTDMPQADERYPIELHLEDDPTWQQFDDLRPVEDEA